LRHKWGKDFYLKGYNLKPLFLFVFVLFIVGMIFGSIASDILDNRQKNFLFNYLDSFLHVLKNNGMEDPFVVFKYTFGNYLKIIGLLWMLSISIIGIPFLVIFVFLKGLTIGFSIGFLVGGLSFKGMLFSLLAVVPQNLLIIPALFTIVVFGLNFSFLFVKNMMVNNRLNIFQHLISFSSIVLLMVFVIFIATLFEAYISPILMSFANPVCLNFLNKAVF